jgi:integrase
MPVTAPKVIALPKPKKEEKKRRERGDGGLYKVPGSDVWYTKIHGKRKTTGTKVKEEAKAILNTRMGRVALGITDPADLRRIKYEDGRSLVLAEYRNEKHASLVTKKTGVVTVWGLEHLNKFFAGRSVVDIDTNLLQEFVEQRRRDGAAPGTINRNLALLRRMLNLLARSHDFRVPHFPHLKESEPRQGFVEHATFAKLFAALPERLKTFVLFLYVTGCRSGEAKKIQWSQVKLQESIIRVTATQTKNKTPRTIPLSPELVKRLRREARARGNEPDVMKSSDLVFPVGCFRKAWQSACVKAGLGTLTKDGTNGGYGHYDGLIPHDLRRSAVRNLRRDGVGESLAMSISGHKTAEVFRRYDITTPEEKVEAVRAIGSSLGQVLKQAQVSK